MEFERVVNGLVRYINRTLIPTMNDWQEFAVRSFLARIKRRSKLLKDFLRTNTFFRAFEYILEDGDFDLDGTFEDMKEAFIEKPVVEIHIPLYGPLRFKGEDLDIIKKYIMEG